MTICFAANCYQRAKKIIERQIANDPQLYRAEYFSEWRDDLSSFIGRELLEASVDVGVPVRPPLDGVQYLAFTDVSGGEHDSFTLGVAHRDKDGCVPLDMLFERRPPFDPYAVTEEVVKLLKTYRCTVVVGDHYAAKWASQAFVRAGAIYRTSQINRSEIYLNVLPLFTSGRARLIDNPRLISQFANLERRTFPTGRDRIDHDRSGHDDLCNAAAGAMDLASRTSAKPLPIHPHPDLSKSGNAYNAPNTNGVPSRYLAKHNEPWRPYVGGSVLPRIAGKYWGPIGQ